MSWPSDPGGQFDTDVHRRVACATADWQALTLDEIWARVQDDDFLDISYDDMVQVLNELSAAGAVDIDSDTGRSKLTETARDVFSGRKPNHVFPHKKPGGE